MPCFFLLETGTPYESCQQESLNVNDTVSGHRRIPRLSRTHRVFLKSWFLNQRAVTLTFLAHWSVCIAVFPGT